MTFTYDPFNDDISRVRFWIGDTNSTAAAFSDEEITALITETGSWQRAAIACIDNVIARLAATPDFTADWLRVSSSSAIGHYRAIRSNLESQLGVSVVDVDGTHVYRLDSQQTESPDYAE